MADAPNPAGRTENDAAPLGGAVADPAPGTNAGPTLDEPSPAADATPSAPPGPTSGPTSGQAPGPTSGPASGSASGPTSGPTSGAASGPFAGLGGHFAPGFMAKYGLVRPLTGRHFAGVCAAVGRATNTDPVLWRVLFAVLTLFGGVGLLAYLIGWLLIPADGDTASPVEAVLGRGRSRTSAPVAVIGGIAAILVFALVASEGLRPAVVGAIVVLGAAVLLSRGTLQRPGQPNNEPYGAPMFGPTPMVPPAPHQSAAGMFGPATPAMPMAPGAPGMPWTTPPAAVHHAGHPAAHAARPAATQPAGVQPMAAAGAPTVRMPATPASEPTVQKSPLAEPGETAEATEAVEATGTDAAEAAETGETAGAGPARPAPETTVAAHGVTPASESPTRPQLPNPPQPPALPFGGPFAPHGPFAPPGPYPPAFGPIDPQPPTRRLPLYGPYPPVPGAGLPWDAPVSVDPMSHYPGIPYSSPPAPKAKEKRPKSRLGKVTIYATAVALGTLATVHLLGASIAGSAYFAVALTIVGLGLVAGAWAGRARLLIPLGFALSLGLLISTVSAIDSGPHSAGRQEVLAPTTVTELTMNSPFSRPSGDLMIDLTQVDFTGQNVVFEASSDYGRIEVFLPPDVDVTVKAKVQAGDANVFNSSWGGLSGRWRTVVDHGEDGPNSGGTLELTISVDYGNLEVHR